MLEKRAVLRVVHETLARRILLQVRKVWHLKDFARRAFVIAEIEGTTQLRQLSVDCAVRSLLRLPLLNVPVEEARADVRGAHFAKERLQVLRPLVFDNLERFSGVCLTIVAE